MQATGTPSDTGTALSTANHVGCLTAPVNGFTYTSAAPLAVDGSITNPTTGDFGFFVVSQLEVFSYAAAGTATESGLTWKFDET